MERRTAITALSWLRIPRRPPPRGTQFCEFVAYRFCEGERDALWTNRRTIDPASLSTCLEPIKMWSHPEACRLCRHLNPDSYAVSTFNSGQRRCKLFKGCVFGEVEEHCAVLENGMNSLPGGVFNCHCGASSRGSHE